MTLDEIKALPIEERQVKLLELYNSKKRDCSMFSSAGNRKVQALISKCMKKVVNKKAIRKEEFEKFVQEQIDKVAKDDRYSEIQDTAVGEVISFWLKKAVNVAGYEWRIDID